MAAKVDPTKHRVLLVGPRVVHLRPFFEKRKYPVVAAGKGVEGMAQLDTSSCAIVVLELNLGDLTATEFLMAARQGHPKATFLLLDESSKAGQIVKALQAGLDGYLATPPDEDRLFYEVERHLLRSAEPDHFNPSTVSMSISSDVSHESGPSGFEDGSTQTAMQSMSEATLQIALTDREQQVNELETKLRAAEGSLAPLKDTLQRFQAAQNSLAGLIDGPLDGESGQRLREQVQLAQVASIEIDSLRLESNAARESRTRLQAELDDALRKLRQANNVVVAEDKSARVEELESEMMVLEGRVSEAEDAAAAAREALSVSEDEVQEARDEATALKVEVAAAAGRVQALESEVEAAKSSSSATTEREQGLEQTLEQERLSHREALAAVKKNLEDEIARVHEQGRVAAEAASAAQQSAARARDADDEARRSADQQAASAAAAAAVAAAVERERSEQQQRRTTAVDAAVAAADARNAAAVAETLANERAQGVERQAAAVLSAVTDAVSRERERLETLHAKILEQTRSGAAGDVDAALGALRTELEARIETERARLPALRAELDALHGAERARFAEETLKAVDNATDIGFQLEDARTRIEFLEEQAAKVHADADDRIRKAENDFKREKLRLIEEKQAAASGSQEAAVRIERFAADSALLKKQNAELQGFKTSLEQQVEEANARAAAAVADAARIKEGAADAIARAKDAADAHLSADAALGAVQAHARHLEEELNQERQRAAAVDAALAAASARLAEREVERLAVVATHERLAVERNEAHARELAARDETRGREVASHESGLAERDSVNASALAERESAHARALSERDTAHAATAAEHAAALAANQAAHAAALAERDAAHAGVLAERDAAGSRLLADAGGATAEVADLRAEITRLRGAHEAELQGVRSALEDDMARVRTEAQQVHVQAQQFVAEAQQRLQKAEAAAERAALHELEPGDGDREQLAARVQAAERESASLRDQLAIAEQIGQQVGALPVGAQQTDPHAPSSSAPNGSSSAMSAALLAEAEALKARIAELEATSQSADPAVLATVRSLVEAIEPLRWGLGSAIDYMYPFESSDQALATHVKNLRLLQATLTRLAAESGKPPMPQ